MDLSWIKDHLGKPLYMALALVALALSIAKVDTIYGFVGAITSAVLFVVILVFVRERKAALSSSDWFRLLLDALEDASQGAIYLRSFDHPDDFQEKHRETLLSLMRLLARKVAEHPDSFLIVGFRPSSSAPKSPVEWLQTELREVHKVSDPGALLSKCVYVIRKQPTANSTSAYLIDQSLMFYNRRNAEGVYEYHRVEADRSILPFLFAHGLVKCKESV
jgi:hypothetical protein